LLAGAVAVGTFFLADARRCLMNSLVEADHDDSLGIQHVLAWLEDFWVLGILLLLFVFPIVALVVLGMAMLALVMLRRLAEWREEREKIACPGCGTKIYPCARSCPECRQPNPVPCAVGFLGASQPGMPADPATQAFRLAEKMRCPECANRLPRAAAGHVCSACGHRALMDPETVAAYDRFVRARLPKTLWTVFLLGLIPLFGAVAGVLWYRTQIVSPYRRHVRGLRNLLLRLLLKIAWFLLLAIQWIPLVGWLSLPAMAWMSHTAYRKAFLRGRH
jgi:cytochrome c-type biogenesis protein CcmH/NrfF